VKINAEVYVNQDKSLSDLQTLIKHLFLLTRTNVTHTKPRLYSQSDLLSKRVYTAPLWIGSMSGARIICELHIFHIVFSVDCIPCRSRWEFPQWYCNKLHTITSGRMWDNATKSCSWSIEQWWVEMGKVTGI
jgi:hypothetical protein